MYSNKDVSQSTLNSPKKYILFVVRIIMLPSVHELTCYLFTYKWYGMRN